MRGVCPFLFQCLRGEAHDLRSSVLPISGYFLWFFYLLLFYVFLLWGGIFLLFFFLVLSFRLSSLLFFFPVLPLFSLFILFGHFLRAILLQRVQSVNSPSFTYLLF